MCAEEFLKLRSGALSDGAVAAADDEKMNRCALPLLARTERSIISALRLRRSYWEMPM